MSVRETAICDLRSANCDLRTAICELRTAPEPVVREALDFIMFLKSRTGTRAAGEVDTMGYPLGYFESTAGSFAGEPLERPEQPPLDSPPA